MDLTAKKAFETDALTLAFVGDAVWHLTVRTYLATTSHAKIGTLHAKANSFVSAKAQSVFFDQLEQSLLKDEVDIARRARNAPSHNVPKGTSLEAYKKSTSFEAVVGYNWLVGNFARVQAWLIQMKETLV